MIRTIRTDIPRAAADLADALQTEGYDPSEFEGGVTEFTCEDSGFLIVDVLSIAMAELMTVWIDDKQVTRDGYKVRS